MSPSARARARSIGFQVFYGLPARWRRRIVRLVAPKYIIGAVTMVHDVEAGPPGRLLLLRQPPGVGWSLPAGLLARGERAIDGAVRELAEESGIQLHADDLMPATPSAIVHSNGRWVDVVYRAAVPARTVALQADGAEVLEVAWHRLDALPPLTTPTARLLGYYGIGPYAGYPETRTD